MNTNNSRNLLIFQETVQSNFDCFVWDAKHVQFEPGCQYIDYSFYSYCGGNIFHEKMYQMYLLLDVDATNNSQGSVNTKTTFHSANSGQNADLPVCTPEV